MPTNPMNGPLWLKSGSNIDLFPRHNYWRPTSDNFTANTISQQQIRIMNARQAIYRQI